MAELELSRYLAVPANLVWRAFTDPAALAAWYWPARFETKVSVIEGSGGSYRIDGSAVGIATSGDYLIWERPRQLAFTWQWDGEQQKTVVTIALHEDESGTQLQLRHAGFLKESTRDDHVEGWSDCFDRLPAWLASQR